LRERGGERDSLKPYTIGVYFDLRQKIDPYVESRVAMHEADIHFYLQQHLKATISEAIVTLSFHQIDVSELESIARPTNVFTQR
jgi:hypothetical protein